MNIITDKRPKVTNIITDKRHNVTNALSDKHHRITFVSYDFCRHMMFVAYAIFCLTVLCLSHMTYVALSGLSLIRFYGVSLMTFVAVLNRTVMFGTKTRHTVYSECTVQYRCICDRFGYHAEIQIIFGTVYASG